MATAVDKAVMVIDSAVLPGVVGEEVGDVAARAGRHQHHAQRDAGRRLDHQHQQEGEGRQQDELPDQADQHRLGHGQHGLEVGHLEVERDAEHHQADDGVERPQRLRIEVQPDQVHFVHGVPRPARPPRGRPTLTPIPPRRETGD
jgi:hypothetical protein